MNDVADLGVAGGKDSVAASEGDSADSLNLKDPLKALAGREVGDDPEEGLVSLSYLPSQASRKALYFSVTRGVLSKSFASRRVISEGLGSASSENLSKEADHSGRHSSLLTGVLAIPSAASNGDGDAGLLV